MVRAFTMALAISADNNPAVRQVTTTRCIDVIAISTPTPAGGFLAAVP
jgi:hypothetical protein